VTPGITSTGTLSYAGSQATSSKALAIANTPGSPDDTTTTRDPLSARSSANAARSVSTRLSDGCRC
jgi:hypothetical protein